MATATPVPAAATQPTPQRRRRPLHEAGRSARAAGREKVALGLESIGVAQCTAVNAISQKKFGEKSGT